MVSMTQVTVATLLPPPQVVKVKVAQSYLTLCDLTDYRVHGILQARRLEWVAFSLLQGNLSNPGIKPRSPALQADVFFFLPAEPSEKPKVVKAIYKK